MYKKIIIFLLMIFSIIIVRELVKIQKYVNILEIKKIRKSLILILERQILN